jgi:hypothetical protein
MLACLRLAPGESAIRQIGSLSRAGVAWPNLLRLVDRHRTAPLVYQNLKRFGDKVPAEIMSRLRSRFQVNIRRSLANTAELVRLDELFRKNQIPCLSLKGSVLASQVYGNLALRHAGDIDLLVAPRQVERAHQLLQSNYRRLLPNFRLTPSQHQRLLRVMHHYEYLHTQVNLRLELHWRPIHDLPPDAFDFSQLLARATTVTLAGSPLPALSLPDNILYLCGHGGMHFWVRLFWLVDLAEIIRQNPAVDWAPLTTLAAAAGLLPQLALGVVLAHKLLAAPLPEAFQTWVWRDPLVSYLAQVSCRYLLCPDPDDSPLAFRLHLYACRLRVANSLAAKRHVMEEIFLGRDWATTDLPDNLFFLHYVLRHPHWLQRKLRRGRNQMASDMG